MKGRTLGYIEEVVTVCDFKGLALAFFVYERNMASSWGRVVRNGIIGSMYWGILTLHLVLEV